MGRSKINESWIKNVEGVLNLDEEPSMEIEEIGTVTLKDLFKRFNGENIKISMSLSNDGESGE